MTYREFLLYLEEYQRTKLPEFKTRKIRAKPAVPVANSSHNDYSFASPKMLNNYVQSSGTFKFQAQAPRNVYEINFPACYLTKINPSGDTAAIQSGPAMHSKQPRSMAPNYLPLEMPEGLPMPPKFMNDYLGNFDRGRGVSNPEPNRRTTQKLQDRGC